MRSWLQRLWWRITGRKGTFVTLAYESETPSGMFVEVYRPSGEVVSKTPMSELRGKKVNMPPGCFVRVVCVTVAPGKPTVTFRRAPVVGLGPDDGLWRR